jgi:hypothetical protein
VTTLVRLRTTARILTSRAPEADSDSVKAEVRFWESSARSIDIGFGSAARSSGANA